MEQREVNSFKTIVVFLILVFSMTLNLKAGNACSRTRVWTCWPRALVWVLVAWGLGLHQPEPPGLIADLRISFSPFHCSRVDWSVDFSVIPAVASLAKSGPPGEHTPRTAPSIPVPPSLPRSLARPPGGPGVRVDRHIPALIGEARLPRPRPLLPSGLLSCFLKPILFVFNIVIFCLMSYYSYGYYSFIPLQ